MPLRDEIDLTRRTLTVIEHIAASERGITKDQRNYYHVLLARLGELESDLKKFAQPYSKAC